MMFRFSFIVIVILLLNGSGNFSFSEPLSFSAIEPYLIPDTVKLNDGTDPSQPLSRIDLQNDFYWDWLELKDDRYYNVTSINGGKTFYKGKLYLYLSIPLVTTNFTFETQTGLGDISFDIQYSTNNKNKLNIISGSSFIFPAGSSSETGFGKFIAVPYAGIIDYFRSGYYGLVIADYFSFAGQANRNDIHELSLNPILKINMGKNWYTLITPDIRYNFKSGNVFIPYTQEFGKLFNKNFAASLKAGIHLKNDKRYDVLGEIKFSFLL